MCIIIMSSCVDDSYQFVEMSFLFRVYISSRIVVLPSATLSSRRYSHNKTSDDFRKYRREMTALRLNFMTEYKHHIKVTTEDFGSQAAQEARTEKEREENALENNERELKRMAEIRELKRIQVALTREKRIEQGIEARIKSAKQLKERRTKAVVEMNERSKNFVTMENLEEKINEALEKEVSHNFALSIQGEIIENEPPVPTTSWRSWSSG